MKFCASICKVIGYIWLVLAGLLIVMGIIGVWINDGFSGVQEILSPFNVVNYIVTAITIAPGLGLLALSDKLKRRVEN